MSYSDFARRAFPPTLLMALACAGWAWRVTTTATLPPAATGAPAERLVASQAVESARGPVAEPIVIPAPAAAPTGLTLPPPDALLTATPGPGPEGVTNQPEPAPKVWLSDFDRALDREFSRLEEREKTSRDPVELAMVERLKEKLLALDALWIRADNTSAVEEKIKIQLEAQQTMGEIIQLGRADRNQRLTGVALSFGVESGPELTRFLEEVDRAFVETHLDWARLFNRGAATPQSSP